MGFFDEKRLRGTVHNGLIRGAGLHLHVWRSEGSAGGGWRFLILLTRFNFPGPSTRCHNSPASHFHLTFLLSAGEKRPPTQQPAGATVRAGFKCGPFDVKGPHLNI